MEHKKEEEESSIAHELAEVVVVAGKVEKGLVVVCVVA